MGETRTSICGPTRLCMPELSACVARAPDLERLVSHLAGLRGAEQGLRRKEHES